MEIVMRYFAYGSNMDPAQMAVRCPDAVARGVGYLKDHALCFPRHSVNRACGVSSVEPKVGHNTWGVIYELNEADLTALDKSEGYRIDRDPSANAYNRVEVKVYCDGQLVEMETYVASPQPGSHVPSDQYLSHLLAGASHHGLPGEYQQYLKGLSPVGSNQSE